ncbi:MAG TPA: class I SAM-dependent methyltransferase [Roseiflexaceae bacterium]|nr:class I SAM-dependent methyltransferase [Roseiflexaceae bacterium]
MSISLTQLHAPLIPILHYALAQARLPRDGLALDLACGAGEKLPLLVAALGPGVRLLGVDIDRAAVRELADSTRRHENTRTRRQEGDRAQEPAGCTTDASAPLGLCAFAPSRLRVLAADAHALPLRNACLDAAFCVAALGLFAHPHLALRELRRVLRPGAPALIVTAERLWAPVVRWPEDLAARLCGRLHAIHGEHGEHGYGTPTRVPSCPPWITNPDLGGDLAALLASAGFAPQVRAFLLEDAPHPLRLELPLLPWPALRPLVAGALPPADLARYDASAGRAEIELVSVALVAVAS